MPPLYPPRNTPVPMKRLQVRVKLMEKIQISLKVRSRLQIWSMMADKKFNLNEIERTLERISKLLYQFMFQIKTISRFRRMEPPNKMPECS